MTQATVLITTKDRHDVLRNALTSVYEQDVSVEVIVVDDGSSDSTTEMVRIDYPKARLVRNDEPLGIISARNAGAKLASTDILFTLDDDAVFTATNTISRVLQLFQNPRVGVVAIPHVNIAGQSRTMINHCAWASEDDFPVLRSYAGGANAKRIGVFNSLGGYGGSGRQGEERGYALRLLDAGYVVRAADTAPIHHFPDQRNRDSKQLAEATARNSLIFGWENTPLNRVPDQMARLAAGQLIAGVRGRCCGAALRGLTQGIAALPSVRRHPVSNLAFAVYLKLRRESPLKYSSIAHDMEELSRQARRRSIM